MARDTFKTPFTLRPYQTPAVEYIERVAAGMLNDAGGNWHLMSAPTGTGKSLIELEALSRVPGSILITPRLEIIAGMCSKMGHYVDGMGDNELAAFAWNTYGVTTPIRLRNLLIKGELPYAPSLLIVDECFPAGTLVDTPHGPRAIETINTGDSVLTYDEVSGTIKTGRVGELYRNPAPARMVEIRAAGRVITCTANHPFLTRRGWINAEFLDTADELYCLHEPHESAESDALPLDPIKDAQHTTRNRARAPGSQGEWNRLDSVAVLESTDSGEPNGMRGTGTVYNFEVEGTHTYLVSGVVVHNCHHDLAQTYQDVTMFLNGVPKVGLTATPYRGTPRGTSEFLKQWGDTVVTILTLRDAVKIGAYQMPNVEIWPLIDDDTIDVSAGEFKVTSVTSAVKESSAHIAHLSRDWFDRSTRLYDMATLYAVPSTDAVNDMVARLRDAGLPAVSVTQDTPRVDRIKAFELTEQCRAALVQISVVSEGVDLRIRRVVDAKSTLSPNAWFQLVGRVRPDDSGLAPEYICCNRNVERHCYLWEGLLPNSKVQEAQTAFTDDTGAPLITQRAGMRVVGLEGLGKFVKVPIFLLDGTIGFMYNIVHVHENRRTEYIAFVHPNYPEPVYGVKESAHDGIQMQWGKWRVVDALPELKGCASAKASTLTPKQQDRWNASAENFGLDPNRKITGREFQILPFLRETGLRF